MADRPSDHDIATYINDLENALADAEAPAITNSRLLDTVHPWAATLVHVDNDAEVEPAGVTPCTECGHTDHPGEGRLLEDITDNPNPHHQETI